MIEYTKEWWWVNKIKMILILLIAVGGALLIYNYFEKKRSTEIEVNKFNNNKVIS